MSTDLTALVDVKPNNIFVDGYIDKEDQFHLQRVVLGDMDVALKLKDNDLINAKVAKGVGKHSDRFSFGLLVGCFHHGMTMLTLNTVSLCHHRHRMFPPEL